MDKQVHTVTEKHIAHRDKLIQAFETLMSSKYIAGVKEHGGHLEDMGELELLDNAISENIDQFTYLMTMRDKVFARQKVSMFRSVREYPKGCTCIDPNYKFEPYDTNTTCICGAAARNEKQVSE